MLPVTPALRNRKAEGQEFKTSYTVTLKPAGMTGDPVSNKNKDK